MLSVEQLLQRLPPMIKLVRNGKSIELDLTIVKSVTMWHVDYEHDPLQTYFSPCEKASLREALEEMLNKFKSLTTNQPKQ